MMGTSILSIPWGIKQVKLWNIFLATWLAFHFSDRKRKLCFSLLTGRLYFGNHSHLADGHFDPLLLLQSCEITENDT